MVISGAKDKGGRGDLMGVAAGRAQGMRHKVLQNRTGHLRTKPNRHRRC